MKTRSPRIDPVDKAFAAQQVGKQIKLARQGRGLTQRALAKLLNNMKPQQLCKIEDGKNLPTEKTLLKIAKALQLPIGTFVEAANEGIASDIFSRTPPNAPILQRLMPTCTTSATTEELELVAKDLTQSSDPQKSALLKEYVDLLQKTIPGFTFNLREFATVSFDDGVKLALNLRDLLNIGCTPLKDVLPVLEQANIRIVFVPKLPPIRQKDLPDKLRAALSFYDMYADTPVICISNKAPPEEQLYNLAYELANVLVFRNKKILGDAAPVIPPERDWEFGRGFASEILMPINCLDMILGRLNPRPKDWSAPLIDNLRQRFGVSRNAFVWRLHRIGKLTEVQRKHLWEKLEKNPDDLASSRIPPLPQNTWLATLRIRASTSN